MNICRVNKDYINSIEMKLNKNLVKIKLSKKLFELPMRKESAEPIPGNYNWKLQLF